MSPEIGFLISGKRSADARRVSAILGSLKRRKVRVFLPDVSQLAPSAGENCSLEQFDEDHPDALLQWMDRNPGGVLVIDGSPDIFPAIRLTGQKVILIRRHGRWDPEEHVEAFREADSLIASFPRMMEQPDTPEWVQEKTLYCGGIFHVGELFATPTLRETLALRELEQSRRSGVRHVALYLQNSQESLDSEAILQGVAECRAWTWIILGDVPIVREGSAIPENIRVIGDVTSPHRFFRLSEVAVGDADEGTVIEAAISRTPYICVPQETPYDEERFRADVLRSLDIATVLDRWPLPHEWCDRFIHASSRPGNLHVILEDSGARKAAKHIEERIEN